MSPVEKPVNMSQIDNSVPMSELNESKRQTGPNKSIG